LERYPKATVLASPKAAKLLVDFKLVPREKVRAVADGETLSLGTKALEFIHAPWVHWPDTMFTYLQEDKVLLTCDFLGSHLATSNLYAIDEATVYESAKRYYAEIMMPFRNNIRKHLDRIKELKAEVICPSHGPLYSRPEFIIDAYRDWSSEDVKNEVVLPFASMHGSTKAMVNHFTQFLMERGITVKRFDLTATDLGKLAMALVDAATVVVGSPTVLTGPHPLVIQALSLANALRPKTRFASIIGSYGWGGKMTKDILSLIPNLKVELIEPVVIKGHPGKEDLQTLDRLADEILERHKALGIA
jgi:flavorubredoxin